MEKQEIKKWEYNWVPSKEEGLLNMLGSQGWEAYAVTEDIRLDSVRIWMKRPLVQE